jgi:hypothetical protein
VRGLGNHGRRKLAPAVDAVDHEAQRGREVHAVREEPRALRGGPVAELERAASASARPPLAAISPTVSVRVPGSLRAVSWLRAVTTTVAPAAPIRPAEPAWIEIRERRSRYRGVGRSGKCGGRPSHGASRFAYEIIEI